MKGLIATATLALLVSAAAPAQTETGNAEAPSNTVTGSPVTPESGPIDSTGRGTSTSPGSDATTTIDDQEMMEDTTETGTEPATGMGTGAPADPETGDGSSNWGTGGADLEDSPSGADPGTMTDEDIEDVE
jgi:hypothetical protein